MLSILIPTYNYNIVPLVKQLHKQCLECDIKFEILVYDDGSLSPLNIENDIINKLSNSKFEAHKKNIGLSSNRNALAKASKYEYFLFIDGDSIVINKNYIDNYANAINNNTEIIYGGRIHPKIIENPKQKLRWKYGKKVEDKTAIARKVSPYRTLMFNNTLIRRDCFDRIQFNQEIKKYGHEDTLFAYKASLLKLNVDHIDNPVEHGDIDDTDTFINKTETALRNIAVLYNTNKISYKFVKILSLYKLIEDLKLKGFISFLFKKTKQILRGQLLFKNPSLFVFKIYKIGYLCLLKTD